MIESVHRRIWRDPERRAQKLLRFGATETDGGRDLVRASELTPDPLLRRLYLVHGIDEHRHGEMFRRRGGELLRELPLESKPKFQKFQAEWLAPGGHGADDLDVDNESDDDLLAFLHISEKSAAERFTIYRDVLQDDVPTREIFEEILRDEVFHMNYTLMQLARVSPKRHRRHIYRARLSRLWKSYLRLATAIAGVIGSLLLTIQYFVFLPPFAWLAKRAERREPRGWTKIPPENDDSLRRQY